jgi:ApaG protein
MIEQITKGIKISIESEFEGTFYKDDCIHYAFSYDVIIENQSHEVAQLIARK